MSVQFQRALCLKHNLPLNFICCDMNCSCYVRLCQRCAQEHQKKRQVDQDLLNETVYAKKMEIQIEIIEKQYGHYQQYQSKESQAGLLNSKNQESIQNVQNILRALKEEKKSLFQSLEEFNFNHCEVKKKLIKIKDDNPVTYLASLRNKQISSLASRMLSNIGLERLRKKVLTTHRNSQKYQDFINAVKKYGSNVKQFLQGLSFKQSDLFLNRLSLSLSEWRGDRKVELNFQPGLVNQPGRQRQDIKSRERIYSQSPRRRINVFTGKAYKLNSGKEN